jgi:hypothetical protein
MPERMGGVENSDQREQYLNEKSMGKTQGVFREQKAEGSCGEKELYSEVGGG